MPWGLLSALKVLSQWQRLTRWGQLHRQEWRVIPWLIWHRLIQWGQPHHPERKQTQWLDSMRRLAAQWIRLWIKALGLGRQIWEFRLMRVLRPQWMLQM